jgi:hypothetical protein
VPGQGSGSAVQGGNAAAELLASQEATRALQKERKRKSRQPLAGFLNRPQHHLHDMFCSMQRVCNMATCAFCGFLWLFAVAAGLFRQLGASKQRF